MDVRSIQAATGYGAARQPAAASAAEIAEAGRDFEAMLRGAETEAAAALAGGGDPHALVMALSEARLALEATVAVRDKVVEAYQDLMRMPV